MAAPKTCCITISRSRRDVVWRRSHILALTSSAGATQQATGLLRLRGLHRARHLASSNSASRTISSHAAQGSINTLILAQHMQNKKAIVHDVRITRMTPKMQLDLLVQAGEHAHTQLTTHSLTHSYDMD